MKELSTDKEKRRPIIGARLLLAARPALACIPSLFPLPSSLPTTLPTLHSDTILMAIQLCKVAETKYALEFHTLQQRPMV